MIKNSKYHLSEPSAEQAISSKQADRRYTSSSSFKMALLFTLLLGGAVSALGYFINQFNEESLIREAELGIDINIASFRDWLEADLDISVEEILAQLYRNHTGTWYTYFGSNGNALYGNLRAPERQISSLTDGIIQFQIGPKDVTSAVDFTEPRAVAAKIHTFPDGSRLLVAQDIEEALVVSQMVQILGGAAILLMLVVIGTSFFISNYVVSAINNIAVTARKIVTTGDLSRRIEIHTRWDDLSNLAAILNEMLARIEHLMQGVRRVSDNIAHDLRTPLSRLRSRIEELDAHLQAKGDSEEHQFAERLIEEADRLLLTFNALLRIANIESGKRHSEFARVDLRELVQDVVDFYQPLAEEKDVQMEVSTIGLEMQGDRDLLFQALANIIDNAVKFSPPGSVIHVNCYGSKTAPVISIRDAGPGIPQADKTKVFDRFFRSEESRHSPGNGLGLSLVAAVIELHKAVIELKDVNPGLEVVIRF